MNPLSAFYDVVTPRAVRTLTEGDYRPQGDPIHILMVHVQSRVSAAAEAYDLGMPNIAEARIGLAVAALCSAVVAGRKREVEEHDCVIRWGQG